MFKKPSCGGGGGGGGGGGLNLTFLAALFSCSFHSFVV